MCFPSTVMEGKILLNVRRVTRDPETILSSLYLSHRKSDDNSVIIVTSVHYLTVSSGRSPQIRFSLTIVGYYGRF